MSPLPSIIYRIGALLLILNKLQRIRVGRNIHVGWHQTFQNVSNYIENKS